MPKKTSPKTPNKITAYIHCSKCINQMPVGTAPMDWSRTQAGFTLDHTLQVWCNRCDELVVEVNLLSKGKIS